MAAISLLLLVLSMSSPYVLGHSAPAAECSTLNLHMAGCISFVVIGSTLEKPDSGCCLGLKKVLDTNAVCLCEGLKNSGSIGYNVNVTKASTLPDACKLNAPPVSSCGLSTPPPAKTPVPAPAPATGSGSGTSTAPAPSPSKGNGGSSLNPISGLSLVLSSALVMLFSRI